MSDTMRVKTLVSIHIPKDHVLVEKPAQAPSDEENAAKPAAPVNESAAILDSLYDNPDESQLTTQNIAKGVTVTVSRRLGKSWVFHKMAVEVGK